MATVLFWEKPGCINNARQQQWLRAAGHEVIARNLLREPWDAARLRRFFGTLPVAAWFNGSAPAIKQGLVRPDTLNEEEALRYLLADPLLIRRPLLQVGERCEAGFDPERIDAWIGLQTKGALPADPETCPKSARLGETAPSGCPAS